MAKQPAVVCLMGPTASSKTALAIALQQVLPVDIISVDSAMVYRGMDIGTAKPTEHERRLAPHRLIDILDPSQAYSAAAFRTDALHAMAEVVAANRIPLLVGGTMLYFKALLQGLAVLPPADAIIRSEIEQAAAHQGWPAVHHQLAQIDPYAAARIHPKDKQRLTRALEVFFSSGIPLTQWTSAQTQQTLPYTFWQFALAPASKGQLQSRIEQRFHQMLANGFEQEVRSLWQRSDLSPDLPALRCVGYRQMWCYLSSTLTYQEMVYQGICATKQLAKRQMTWLKQWQNVQWLDSDKLQEGLQCIIGTVAK